MKTSSLAAVVIIVAMPMVFPDRADSQSAAISPAATASASAAAPQQTAPESTPNSSLQVDREESYLLQKLRIQRDLQDEILKWAQTRFWLLAIASVLVGFFGVRALVREFVSGELKDAMRASAEAQAAAQSARESIREVRTEAGRYKDVVESASTTAATVSEKLQELKTRIDAEGERSVAAADLKIAAVSDQIEELRKTVAALATDSERSRNILKEAESRIAQAREVAQTSEAEFSSNASFNVQLVPFDDGVSRRLAGEISAALTQKGFKVSRAPWGGIPAERFGNDLRISHQPAAQAKAGIVADIAREIWRHEGLRNEIIVEEKELPISNNPDAHIVVFFEKRPKKA